MIHPCHDDDTVRAARATSTVGRSRHMRRATRLVVALSVCGLALPATLAAQSGPGIPGSTPIVPAPTQAKSPFKADRLASKPLSLSPNSVAAPLAYPDAPVVLTWSDVPGAVTYQVDISSTPGFSDIVWSSEVVQAIAVPDTLLPDGQYWWRVKAVDQAGTVGLSSDVARFSKTWPNTIAGTSLSAAPGGPAVSHVFLNPYMTWAAVPGAATYDVELASADQFAAPAFTAVNLHQPFTSPATVGALPNASYRWRVRARDPQKNPGPWTVASSFTKGWVAPTQVFPADGAATHSLYVTWQPVEGAQAYEVQMSNISNNFTGDNLKVAGTTSATGFAPTLNEQTAKSLATGNVFWRVRPVIDGAFGAWSPQRQIVWGGAAAPTPEAVLYSTGDTDSGLSPQLTWTPVAGANVYRVEIATDPAFSNIVESQITTATGWSSRAPLPDNQLGSGYHWRVFWGNGVAENSIVWDPAVSDPPTATFRKQTRVVLGAAAGGQLVSEPPLLTWGHVPGIARYEVELSSDGRFDPGTTRTAQVFGLGVVPGSMTDGDKRLPDGTWSWRVRAVDGGGRGQTWSPVGSFTLTSARPDQKLPGAGSKVVYSPLVTWASVPGACAYEVQVSADPSFKDQTEPHVTAQTAMVPPKGVVSTPGRHYWRVRADYCGDIKGQWSPTRDFRSVFPPSFNLNSIPGKVDFRRRVVVAGQLKNNGATVKRARLFLERRLYPKAAFRPAGVVRTNGAGRFRFGLRMVRTADYRLVWRESATNPEGAAAFGIKVKPRVAFRLASRKVQRRKGLLVKGIIFPKRPAVIQMRTSDGWRTIRKVKPKRARFAVAVSTARLDPGKHRLRLWVPRDKQRRFVNASSRQRSVLVYDRFVIR